MKKRLFSAIRLVFVFCVLLVACKPATNSIQTPTREQPAVIESATPTSLSIQTPTLGQRVVTESATPTTPSDERVKLRWFIGVGTGKTADEVKTSIAFVQKYNNSQDKIKLELEAVTISSHAAIDQLMAEIEAGSPPDIVGPADTAWAGEQLTGYILSLDDLLSGYDLSSVDSDVLDSWRIDGNLIGLPAGSFNSVIFYNKDLFDAANLPYPPHKFEEPYADGDPWTIEKMESIARQLTLDANGKNSAEPEFDPSRITQWGFHWQWDSTRSMAIMFGAGSVVDADGNAVIPQQWREAFNWYYDGMWKKHFIPTNVQVTAMQGNPFYSGKVAMVHSFMWYSPRLVDLSNWDIAAVPSYKGVITTRMERAGIIILNTTQHPAEAVEVAYAIATNPELLLTWEMLPSFEGMRSPFIEQITAKHTGVDWQVIFDSTNYADTTYDNFMPNYRKSYDRLLAFRDLMGMRGDLSLDTEIDKLEADLQALFEETP
jgi:multiple sugar transport system substrate-binding protein